MLRKTLATYVSGLLICVPLAHGAEGDDLPQRAQTVSDVIENQEC